jgi:hypothetical protein
MRLGRVNGRKIATSERRKEKEKELKSLMHLCKYRVLF